MEWDWHSYIKQKGKKLRKGRGRSEREREREREREKLDAWDGTGREGGSRGERRKHKKNMQCEIKNRWWIETREREKVEASGDNKKNNTGLKRVKEMEEITKIIIKVTNKYEKNRQRWS